MGDWHFCQDAVAGRPDWADPAVVTAADLIHRLRRLAARRRWAIEVTEGGSHTKVRLNGRRSVIPRHRGDLPIETHRGIPGQLGLTRADVEE